MSFEVRWLIENRIIEGFNYSQTAQELREGIRHITALLASSQADMVHILLDVSNVKLSSTALHADTMRSAAYTLSDYANCGNIACYGINFPLVTNTLQAVTGLMGMTVSFSETRAEAYSKLQELDTTLPAYPHK